MWTHILVIIHTYWQQPETNDCACQERPDTVAQVRVAEDQTKNTQTPSQVPRATGAQGNPVHQQLLYLPEIRSPVHHVTTLQGGLQHHRRPLLPPVPLPAYCPWYALLLVYTSPELMINGRPKLSILSKRMLMPCKESFLSLMIL